MQRWLLIAVAATALTGYAGWRALVPSETAVEPDPQGEDQRDTKLRNASQANAGQGPGAPLPARRRHEVLNPRHAPADASMERARKAELPPPTADEAREAFDVALANVAGVVAARKRLTADQWQEHYQAANHAFAAYSQTLDAEDLDDAHALEVAYKRLRDSLQKLKRYAPRKR